eukprot:g3311.t1
MLILIQTLHPLFPLLIFRLFFFLSLSLSLPIHHNGGSILASTGQQWVLQPELLIQGDYSTPVPPQNIPEQNGNQVLNQDSVSFVEEEVPKLSPKDVIQKRVDNEETDAVPMPISGGTDKIITESEQVKSKKATGKTSELLTEETEQVKSKKATGKTSELLTEETGQKEKHAELQGKGPSRTEETTTAEQPNVMVEAATVTTAEPEPSLLSVSSSPVPSPSTSTIPPTTQQPTTTTAVPQAYIPTVDDLLVHSGLAKFGSVFTTASNGDASYLFHDTSEVFLHAGLTSQSTPHSLASLPDGIYVFTVINTRGPTLLSQSPLHCRRFTVKDHTIESVAPDTPDTCPDRATLPAQTSQPSDRILQVSPFDLASSGPSRTNVYKLLIAREHSRDRTGHPEQSGPAQNIVQNIVLAQAQAGTSSKPAPAASADTPPPPAAIEASAAAGQAKPDDVTTLTISDLMPPQQAAGMRRQPTEARRQLQLKGAVNPFGDFSNNAFWLAVGGARPGLLTSTGKTGGSEHRFELEGIFPTAIASCSNFQILNSQAVEESFAPRLEIFAFHDKNMNGLFEPHPHNELPNAPEEELTGWPFHLTSPAPLLAPHVLFSVGHRELFREPFDNTQATTTITTGAHRRARHRRRVAAVSRAQTRAQTSTETRHTRFLGMGGMAIEPGDWSVTVGLPFSPAWAHAVFSGGKKVCGEEGDTAKCVGRGGVGVSQVRLDEVREGKLTALRKENLYQQATRSFAFNSPDATSTKLPEGYTLRLAVGLVGTRSARVCVRSQESGTGGLAGIPEADRLVYVKGVTVDGVDVRKPAVTDSKTGCAVVSDIPPGTYAVAVQTQAGTEQVLPTNLGGPAALFDCDAQTGLCISRHNFTARSLLHSWPLAAEEAAAAALADTNDQTANAPDGHPWAHAETVVLGCVCQLRVCMSSGGTPRPGLPVALLPKSAQPLDPPLEDGQEVFSELGQGAHQHNTQDGRNGRNGRNGQNGQNGQNGLNGLNGQSADDTDKAALRGLTMQDGCYTFQHITSGTNYILHALEDNTPTGLPTAALGWFVQSSSMQDYPITASCRTVQRLFSFELQAYWGCEANWWGANSCRWMEYKPTDLYLATFALPDRPAPPAGSDNPDWRKNGYGSVQDVTLLDALRGGTSPLAAFMQESTAALLNNAYTLLGDDPDRSHVWPEVLVLPVLMRKVAQAWHSPAPQMEALTELMRFYNNNTWNGNKACGLAACKTEGTKVKEQLEKAEMQHLAQQLNTQQMQ